jgi:hypothetical protein
MCFPGLTGTPGEFLFAGRCQMFKAGAIVPKNMKQDVNAQVIYG